MQSILLVVMMMPILLAPVNDEDVLTGDIQRAELRKAPYKEWFQAGYANYEPQSEKIRQLQKLTEGVDVKIFLGTWCPDSQEHVPHFFKIADRVNWPSTAIQIIGLGKNKKSPSKLEETYDVNYVPTFILMRDTAEIGRIVESPDQSLEADMEELLSQ